MKIIERKHFDWYLFKAYKKIYIYILIYTHTYTILALLISLQRKRKKNSFCCVLYIYGCIFIYWCMLLCCSHLISLHYCLCQNKPQDSNYEWYDPVQQIPFSHSLQKKIIIHPFSSLTELFLLLKVDGLLNLIQHMKGDSPYEDNFSAIAMENY